MISLVLLNIALHGLEAAAGVQYFPAGMAHAGRSTPGAPIVVRYADDLVAICTSREQADAVKEQLAEWLQPRGLTFNDDKTRIVDVEEGFDFLGFNIRRYPNGKLLIKPSKAAVQRIRSRLAAEVKALHGANAEAVITRLNPVIRGWAAYYRGGVSKEIFSALDHYMWRLTYRWALRTHPNKSKRWVMARYFDAFHPSRRGPLGVRRPGHRPLPGEVLLDAHRPPPHGQRRLVPGRPVVDQLLEGPASSRETTSGPVPATPSSVTAGTVSTVR